jgi:hypothetical protein
MVHANSISRISSLCRVGHGKHAHHIGPTKPSVRIVSRPVCGWTTVSKRQLLISYCKAFILGINLQLMLVGVIDRFNDHRISCLE